MKELEQLDAGSPELDWALTMLMRETFSHEELVKMADQVRSVKRMAPTRSATAGLAPRSCVLSRRTRS